MSSPPGRKPKRGTSTVTTSSITLRRYARAREFVDVVKGLWDSWDTDAFLHDKTSGLFYDERKLHVLDHQGQYFSVRGPLNVAPAPQRHPVIVQAGASPDGRELAAATADVVYCLPDTLEAARAYYVDVKGRMAKYGRAPDEMKILPGLRPTVGRTTAEAHAKFHALQALLHSLVALSTLSGTFGDLSGYPLDGPVPLDRQGPQDLRSISERLIVRVHRDQPTIREAQPAGRRHGQRLQRHRHRRGDRRCDAGLVRAGRLRWVQHHAAVPAGRVRRVCEYGDSGIATAWPVPHGL